MQYVIGAALVLALLFGLVRLIAWANPQTLAKIARYVIAVALIAAGGALILGRQFVFGMVAAGLGIGALFRGRVGGFDLGGGRKSAGKSSSVNSRFVEASLDHDTQRLTGRVLEGTFAGRVLDDLTETDLRLLLTEAQVDPDSAALVEAYLDSRFPRWREDREDDAGPGAGGAADAGAMTDEEAYQILGLAPGAGEAEIRAAHHRLLKGVHPDRGGSTFLASRINLAKDRLLSRHRFNS
ncbi:MAG: molecular chaperone DnaJ [Bauldia sp.]|nr:molecular chaperone DnaJ [Bauldia sp.]